MPHNPCWFSIPPPSALVCVARQNKARLNHCVALRSDLALFCQATRGFQCWGVGEWVSEPKAQSKGIREQDSASPHIKGGGSRQRQGGSTSKSQK